MAYRLAPLSLQPQTSSLHPDSGQPCRRLCLAGQTRRRASALSYSPTSGLYAFALGKFLTDPIWFYLFYPPNFLHETYGLDLEHAKWQIVAVYTISSVGSIGGGALSGWIMNRRLFRQRWSQARPAVVRATRHPDRFVPHLGVLFPSNAWSANQPMTFVRGPICNITLSSILLSLRFWIRFAVLVQL